MPLMATSAASRGGVVVAIAEGCSEETVRIGGGGGCVESRESCSWVVLHHTDTYICNNSILLSAPDTAEVMTPTHTGTPHNIPNPCKLHVYKDLFLFATVVLACVLASKVLRYSCCSMPATPRGTKVSCCFAPTGQFFVFFIPALLVVVGCRQT
jgi:hypothetical protein